jgi:hypothetical protein
VSKQRRHGGSAGESWEIWRQYKGPYWKKVRLGIKNQLIKVRTFSDCCGNYGEPGC